MIEYATRMAERFDKYVIMEIKTKSKQVRFFNSKIGIIKQWNSHVMQINLSKENKMISMEIENPNEKKIKNSIERADKMMKYIAEIPFEIDEDRNYVTIKIFDRNVLNDEKMVDIVKHAIDYGMGNEIAGVMYSQIEKIRISNSKGIFEEDENSMAYLSLRIFCDSSSGHAVSCSRKLENIDARISEEARQIAIEGRKARKIEEGKYNVLLSPLAFSNLISYFSYFSSAFAVESGYSFLENKIGKKVADEKISIYDSGIAIDGIFSRKFDDEGIATRETAIIKEGILKSYLHNSTTAKRHGTKTTGNAGIISPIPWNTVVMHGDYRKEEMLEEMNGLFITNLWYTRFHNYMEGSFSTVARDGAFYIKNGVKMPVKGIRLNDNMERMLKNIEMISKEIKQIYWWEVENPVFAPYVMIKDVRITTI